MLITNLLNPPAKTLLLEIGTLIQQGHVHENNRSLETKKCFQENVSSAGAQEAKRDFRL